MFQHPLSATYSTAEHSSVWKTLLMSTPDPTSHSWGSWLLPQFRCRWKRTCHPSLHKHPSDVWWLKNKVGFPLAVQNLPLNRSVLGQPAHIFLLRGHELWPPSKAESQTQAPLALVCRGRPFALDSGFPVWRTAHWLKSILFFFSGTHCVLR